ncbi:sodium:proton antiporter [Algoriphagus sp. D3-2-R+10]|uniref:cation:proton antiporter n=1 Tax=Algoriphagus aurantiacus TaxID=3103948 RepID=UPI002B3FB53F|nr:sodium:proton antiporter [Algoriphagus sp. D3-2-R+10]MEB2778503.1 sodium:proton antiporter [Algoriphagus sp. D3-2-R+10]
MFSLVVIGVATFAMPWISLLSKRVGISYAIFYLIGGYLLYTFFSENLPSPLPRDNSTAILHLTELIVIISLMGAGIKIDLPFSIRKWTSTLRLVFIAMLLCMVAAVALGYYMLDLNLAAAILLGACLAPTDPVLASDVQVGPPNDHDNPFSKFILTSEAGINDGMAFPFTWLAITVASMGIGGEKSILSWFTYHFLYQIIGGIVLGYILGKAIGYFLFNFSKKFKMLDNLDAFLAISLTLLAYGLTELLHGYGFIAVFVCAITLRHYEKEHEYHTSMHSFIEQIEKMFVAVLLLLLGGAIVQGILDFLTWKMVLFSLVFILIIRPLFAYLSLLGTNLHRREKFLISFFGIRGMGSLFYLSFALNEIAFESEDELWSIVTFSIAMSILIHGITAAPAIRYLNKKANTGK